MLSGENDKRTITQISMVKDMQNDRQTAGQTFLKKVDCKDILMNGSKTCQTNMLCAAVKGQGRLSVSTAREARLLLGHIYLYACSSTRVDFGLQTGKFLEYCSHNWGM